MKPQTRFHLNSPPPRFSQSGFTLIELLTVIAIIGILASILIPVVGRVREAARASNCVSNVRQIGIALLLHVEDNNGHYPAASPEAVPGQGAILWTKALGPYLPQRGPNLDSIEHIVFVCPSAPGTSFSPLDYEAISRTYACTAAMLGANPGGNVGQTARTPRPYSSVIEHSRAPLIVEAKPSSPGATGARSNISWGILQPDLVAASPDGARYLDLRHNERMNVGFADVSVRSMSFEEMKEFDREAWEGREL